MKSSFIDYYKATDFPPFCRIQKKYAPKTTRNTFFLILYEMGQDARDAASWASPKRPSAPQDIESSRI